MQLNKIKRKQRGGEEAKGGQAFVRNKTDTKHNTVYKF